MNLKATKEKFNRTYFNITKKKEKLLFSNKLNKLVALIRKVDKDEAVDELVADIDRAMIEKLENVRDKFRFAAKDGNPGLHEDLQKLYKEMAL